MGLFGSFRILSFRLVGKCAIFLFHLPLEREYSPGYLREAHLSNIPGGKAQCVQSVGGIKLCYTEEVIVREILLRVDPTADQQHIAYAGLHCPTVENLNVEVAQLLQGTAFFIILKPVKVVRQIILHGILGGG